MVYQMFNKRSLFLLIILSLFDQLYSVILYREEIEPCCERLMIITQWEIERERGRESIK